MKNIVVGAVGIAIVIGLVVILVNPFKSSQKSERPTESQSITGALEDLLASGKPLKCTFSYASEMGTTSGTVYLFEKKMRGDFKTTSKDGTSYDSSVIQDNEYGYFWSSMQPQGTKMLLEDDTYEDVNVEDSGEVANPQDFFELDNSEADYDCKSWRTDNSMFVPPSDVEFIDIQAQMEQVNEATEQFQDATKCNVCDQIQDPQAKGECKTALGC